MPEIVQDSLEIIARTLEIVGAGMLILGFILATVHFFSESSKHGAVAAINRYRKALGRVIIIGLELLVAATIIKTITVDPTLEAMGLLLSMVAIRTFLGWTTVLEMSGRWPWQPSKPAKKI